MDQGTTDHGQEVTEQVQVSKVSADSAHQGSEASIDSLAQFVQSFYDGYVPLALGDQHEPAWVTALQQRPSAFAPSLRSALQQDAEAQASADGEIAGLDFDPFLGSQDPCERYEVGRTIRQGDSYRAEIHGVCSGRRSDDPDVVAELVRTDGAWTFMNFHYPAIQTDVLTVLRALHEDGQ